MIDLRPALQAFSNLDAYAHMQIMRAGTVLTEVASGGNPAARRSDLQKLRDFINFALIYNTDFVPDEEREDGYGPFNQINL